MEAYWFCSCSLLSCITQDHSPKSVPNPCYGIGQPTPIIHHSNALWTCQKVIWTKDFLKLKLLLLDNSSLCQVAPNWVRIACILKEKLRIKHLDEVFKNRVPSLQQGSLPTWIVSQGLEAWPCMETVPKPGCLIYFKHDLWHRTLQTLSFCYPCDNQLLSSSCMIGPCDQKQIRCCPIHSLCPIQFPLSMK